MKHTTISLAALLLTGPALLAQDKLLFTTLNQMGKEQTLSGSSGTSLMDLDSEDVEVVQPSPVAPYSAEKFASEKGWQTLMGEADNDTAWHYYQSPLFGKIDAIQSLHVAGTSPTMRDIYLSPSVPVGIPCGRVILPEDVAAIRPNGAIRYLITGIQLSLAFGLPDSANVDAIAQDRFGNLYVSFETDQWILGGAFLLEDGGFGIIQAGAIAYNPDRTVGAVAAGSGIIGRTEPQVDAMVWNSGVADPFGNNLMRIADLDGLAEDPNGGVFMVHWEDNSYSFPNLLFCGEKLTGCSVLTTGGGGNIAQLNGTLLGSPIATQGDQVGLRPNPDGIGSLNGLQVFRERYCRFVLDSPNVDLSAGPGLFELDWGGADPFAPVWIWTRILPRVGCAVANSMPSGSVCFPDDFLCTPTATFLFSDAQGFGSINVPGIGGTGNIILLQFLTPKPGLGGLGWSSPITYEL